MESFQAVLILGHFVVSVFNVPLGNPMYQFIPYPNMEICQQYVQYNVTPPNGYQLSIEHKMYKSATCVTREEFEKQMEKQRQLMEKENPTPPTEEQGPVAPEGQSWWK